MSPLKRKLTFVIVAIALAASAAGAYAATQASSVSPRQAFLNDVAHRLHVTPARLRKAMAGAFADRLAQMVASGRLTKAQASAIQKRMASSGGPGLWMFGGHVARHALRHGWFAYPPGPAFRPNGKPGARALPPGAPFPPAAALPAPPMIPHLGGPAGPFRFGFGLAFGLMPGGFKAALSYLDIRPAKLMAELRSGKSIAQITRAQGKTVSGLESAVRTSINARLKAQVARGHLTSSQATKLLAAFDARIAAAINMHIKFFTGRGHAFGRMRAFGWGGSWARPKGSWARPEKSGAAHGAAAQSSGASLSPA